MKKWLLSGSIGLALAAGGMASAQADDEKFDIQRFEVTGNTILSEARIHQLMDPMAGKQRHYGDVQKALEALEGAYRELGYGTVQVEVPEQELTSGVVRLNVVEVTIGQVNVIENKYFSTDNVKRAFRALRPGQAPNLRELSENVQLSNENPAKQVEVTLGVGEVDDTVDAKIKVTDKSPHHFGLSVDNTGAPSSGNWRTGFSYQFANLFDRDQTVSLAYTTSPDSPEGVKINQFSIGYRVPLYELGDSVDMLFGKSSSTTPSSTPNLAGALNIVGKGDVAGIHYNHACPRVGESTYKLVTGLDYKYIDSRCSTVGGGAVNTDPNNLIAPCIAFTVMPVSAAFSSSTRSGTAQLDFNIGLSVNIAIGDKLLNPGTGRRDRYSFLTPGNRDTKDNYMILRGGGSYLQGFANDMQVRVAVTAQFSPDPAVLAEQFGLAGSMAVRGFSERAVAADSGVLVVSELYSPDIAAKFGWENKNLRCIVFIDAAHGFNPKSNAVVPSSVSIASFGFGVRAALGKETSIRADIGRVINAGTAISEQRGDVKGHISLTFGF
jgi:hemolysin activation/secretion protein